MVELGGIVMKDVLKKANLKPVAGAVAMETKPDKLKYQGITDLEKKFYDWDAAAAEIAIDEVIMGNVLQAAQGQNPARQAMIAGGIPKETPAFTINKVCGSGLQTSRQNQGVCCGWCRSGLHGIGPRSRCSKSSQSCRNDAKRH